MSETRLVVEIDEELKYKAKVQALLEKTTLKDKIIVLLNQWLNSK